MEAQVVALAADWPRIREDPRFVELMRLARAANSLALAWPFLIAPPDDERPSARRGRFAALFYASALLNEGLRSARSLGKWYRDTEQYQQGFGALFADSQVSALQRFLFDDIRNKIVFHFDRPPIADGLKRLPENDWVILSYDAQSGPTHGGTYFDAADDAVLGYLFGDATTDQEYLARLEEFMSAVTGLLDRFLSASHRLIAFGLLQLGCKKRHVDRSAAGTHGSP